MDCYCWAVQILLIQYKNSIKVSSGVLYSTYRIVLFSALIMSITKTSITNLAADLAIVI